MIINNRTGISVIAFKNAMEIREFLDAVSAESLITPFFELSYKMGPEFLDEARFLKGKVLSVHAPCPAAASFPNLGSADTEVIRNSLQTIRSSAETAVSFGAEIIVLHAGYTLDSSVSSEFGKRAEMINSLSELKPYSLDNKGSICTADYCASDLYKRYLDRTIKNLRKASAICSDMGIVLAVENLNPRLTYLFQLPEEFVLLAEEVDNIGICVDIGHLYISSLLHRFDFKKAVRTLINTGKVVTTHIHDNISRGGRDPLFTDDHDVIGSGNVPVGAALEFIAENRNINLVIESIASPIDNLKMLADLAE